MIVQRINTGIYTEIVTDRRLIDYYLDHIGKLVGDTYVDGIDIDGSIDSEFVVKVTFRRVALFPPPDVDVQAGIRL